METKKDDVIIDGPVSAAGVIKSGFDVDINGKLAPGSGVEVLGMRLDLR